LGKRNSKKEAVRYTCKGGEGDFKLRGNKKGQSGGSEQKVATIQGMRKKCGRESNRVKI